MPRPNKTQRTTNSLFALSVITLMMTLLITPVRAAEPDTTSPPAKANTEETNKEEGTAADTKPTIQEQITRNIKNDRNKNFITLTVENDMLGSGDDGNYTSGVLLTWFNAGTEPRYLAELLDGVIPTFSINETTSVSFSIGQNIYTPDDITISAPQPAERPWAAWLYTTMGLSSLTDNHIDDVSATIGVVGPMALGRQAQTTVHRIMGVNKPRGWDNQIKNEPGLVLSWRRRWPSIWEQDYYNFLFTVMPDIGASVGNIYTFAETGVTFRISPEANRWQDTPTQVQPSIPGTGYFEAQHEGLGWYLFGGMQGRAIARNIFLDGNTFRDSASVDKKPLVFDANAGIALTYGNARLSYTAVYRTREFDGQNKNALYAGVSLGFKF